MVINFPSSGLLLIDKPAGITSFGVVRRGRRVLKVRKVGHLGTLDPFATGLLPLCVGEATKLTPFLMEEPKTYRARLKLGEETDTQDLTGRVTARCESLPTPAQVRQAAARFLGELDQTPPMYSAVHHQGERLYRLARRGEVVEVKPRRVVIHELVVEEVALPAATIRVTCSKGTYIRTLAADLGAALGCGAHLTALRRLAVGPFRVEAALPLAALEEAEAEREIRSRLIPLGECLPGLAAAAVDPQAARSLRQGRAIPWAQNGLTPGERVKVLLDGELVAVGAVSQGERQFLITPVRVFGVGQA